MIQLFFKPEEKKFIIFLKDLLSKEPLLRTDESAAPSFIHKNLLIRFFFWQRIRWALRLAQNLQMLKVLDFGTGSGVLLPFLNPLSKTIYALDLDTTLAERIKEEFDLTNIKIINYKNGKIPLPPDTINLVFALEVFEHIEDLHRYIDDIYRICKKNAYLLFSIPTENYIYKTGRFFSGFKGDYHKTSIDKIINAIEKRFVKVKFLKLYPIIPIYIFGIFKKE